MPQTAMAFFINSFNAKNQMKKKLELRLIAKMVRLISAVNQNKNVAGLSHKTFTSLLSMKC